MPAARRSVSLGRHGSATHARGEAIADRGSIFTAHCVWPVRSGAAAAAAIVMMRAADSGADHHMSAFRVTSAPKKIEKGYDDDGEARGGQRLMGALIKAGATNVAVVVSRVYGGQNLGKVRFEHIAERATTLLSDLGHVVGVGIKHAWGDGVALGGMALGGSQRGGSQGAGSSSAHGREVIDVAKTTPGSGTARTPPGGGKRKAEAPSPLDAAAEAAERRARMAAAAEARLASLASSSGGAGGGG